MPNPRAALPEDAVLLHIGPHKTGTTAIQGLLAGARQDLAAHGVTYPGRRGAHHDEARTVLGRPGGWAHDSAPLPPQQRWRRLTRSVHRAPGRVVVSSEFFALGDDEHCRRVVDDLGPERLHLLVAARNPGSIALSTWQQVLRDGKAGRLEDWLEERFRRPEPAPATSGFWSWSDAATLVDRWSRFVDLDRIRVVVIDETDRALLPTTFEDLLGLPAGLLAGRTPPRSNRSLTAPEAELLRCAIALTKEQLSWEEFALLFRTGFTSRLLYQRVAPADEARSVLPAWAASQAAAEAASISERLAASGVAIIGDLDSLLRIPAGADAAPVEQVPVELAAQAVAGVVDAAQRQFRRDRDRLAAGTGQADDGPTTDATASRTVDDLAGRELAAELWSRARRKVGLGNRAR